MEDCDDTCDGGEKGCMTEDIEKDFHRILFDKVEQFIIDEEMSLQNEIINELADNNYIEDDLESFSDLGELQIRVIEEK
jgi:hypothetical protein